ncbi:MAG: DUF2490 domain-containing protein [Flavobacteriales bacterium]|nr:DUF2490 domain-containing protein [Flavobacteriales bacterium]
MNITIDRALRVAVVTYLCLAVGITKAQPNDVGNWMMYFGSQPFVKKFNWHNEVQLRNYNFVGDLEQLLLRTGMGINLSENNNNLLLGYGFIRAENYQITSMVKSIIEEHRIFQQFITRQRFGRVFLQHRYRLEERFFTRDFRTRFRYFVSVNIILNKPKHQKGAWYLSLYNEVFINGEQTLFDRNRIYGALGYNLRQNLRLEVGAMAQLYTGSHRSQTQIALFNTIPFLTRQSTE